MAKYVFDAERGIMVDKETGLPMLNQEERAREPQCPMGFGDFPGYRSPIDGRWIEGRRARRYDMEKNGCVDGNELMPSQPRRLKNERFIRKRNLWHLAD